LRKDGQASDIAMITSEEQGISMIDVYGGNSPNVIKVLVALEECALDYERLPLDIMKGEQFSPEFLAISPNNRIPAIIDHNPADGGEPLSLFESGAILLYLADKTGMLIPRDARTRAAVIAWVMWQMGGQGPMLGQAHHFRLYTPEKIPYAIERYTKETARLYRVLDTRLADREYLAGDYSIADIACWPWILFRDYHGIELEDYPNVAGWFAQFGARAAVKKALGDFTLPPAPVMDQETKRILFNIK
jgi:GST-like protein